MTKMFWKSQVNILVALEDTVLHMSEGAVLRIIYRIIMIAGKTIQRQ